MYTRLAGLLAALILCLAPALLLESCGHADEIDLLVEWMTGSFDSAAQAEADTNFFDIHLQMKPIWSERTDARWLYVEQAAAWALEKPYRQRVYRVSFEDGEYVSRVYALPDPEAAIGAWALDAPLADIGPDDLIEREGCAVYLQRDGEVFSGGTRGEGCGSTLRGAAYATSEIMIAVDRLTSWDRGWDAEGEQAWGAVTGPYVFVKK